MANRTTNEYVFFNLLKRIDEYNTRQKKPLNEMATLHKNVSNLPTTLWLDDDNKYKRHAPRIKFRMGYENTTREYTSMEINNPDRLYNVPKKSLLSARDIEQIKSFVRVNKQILLDFCNHSIDFDTFKKNMKKVNNKGEVIEHEVKIGKFVNGFALYQENGKYNYIDINGKFLFSETDLDFADNFVYYGDDILLAFVSKNGRQYYIDNKGKEVSF